MNYIIFGKCEDNIALWCDFISLYRPIVHDYGVKFWRKVLRRGNKCSSAAGWEKRREFFFFFSVARRIYGLIRRRNLAVALTPLSRRPFSQHPNLHPCVRAKALRLASRMLPASFFVLARDIMGGTCARWCARRTHSRNREYLWGIRRVEGWKITGKSPTGFVLLREVENSSGMRHAIVGDVRRPCRDGIRDDVSRLRARSAVISAKYEIDRKRPRDRPEVLWEKKIKRHVDSKKLVVKDITLFVIARNINSNNLVMYFLFTIFIASDLKYSF